MGTKYTLTYNEDSQGWPSFYSFFPEFTMGMNAYLYTFQGGNLFRHNTNVLRNTFYGSFADSTITSVFNPEPTLSIKLFKTLSYESTTEDANPDEARWNCTSLLTDLSQGNITDLNFDVPEINKWRFKSKKIFIKPNILESEEIFFTNDAYNKPQLLV